MADKERLGLAYNRRKDKLRGALLQEFGVLYYSAIDDALASLGSYAVTEDYYDLLSRASEDVRSRISSSSPERALPVRAKEQAVDEWGGLMKLHDDVQRLADIDQRRQEAARKQAYKRELDAQVSQSRLGISSDRPDRSKQVAQWDNSVASQDKINEARRQYMIAKMREQSQEDIHRAAEHKKRQEQLEREEFLAKLRYDEQKSKIDSDITRLSRQREQNKMNEVNYQLKLAKEEAKARERENDKVYARAGFITSDSNEAKRRKYLEDNRILNQEMAHRLLEFKKDRHDQAKSFEQISLHDKISLEREDLQRIKLQRSNKEQAETLKLQIQQREQLRLLEKQEDYIFANGLKEHSLIVNSLEQEQAMLEKDRQRQYRRDLQRQIEEQKLSKRSSHTMTSEERKFNGPELSAFKRGLPEIYSKHPGLHERPSVSKSPDRLANQSRYSRQNISQSPTYSHDRSLDMIGGANSPLKKVHRSVLAQKF